MTTPYATPDDGRPSFEARARLAADLHDQLASSRMAWDAALLRSDAALASGDDSEVQAALADHRMLLGVLEERLGAVVAAATVTREAEQVVRDTVATVGADPTPVDPDARRAPAAPSAGRGLVTALAGAAAAVVLLAGVLGGDLRLGADGTIAGTSTQEQSGVRARISSSSVVPPDLPGYGATAGPRAALPRFSGSLPPSTTPTAPAPVSGPETAGVDSDPETAAEAPVGRDDATLVEVPGSDVPTTVDTPGAPSLPRPVELVERLVDREGGDGADVDASAPSPLAEVIEVLPEAPDVPPASEPTGGLG